MGAHVVQVPFLVVSLSTGRVRPDGTLVDSAADIAEALNRTLEDIGMARVPEATVLGWIGDGVRRLVEQAVHAQAARSTWPK